MNNWFRIELKHTNQIELPHNIRTKLAIFRPILDKEKNHIGKPQLKVKVFIPDFVYFIREIGFEEVKKDKLYESNDYYRYLRAMVYGAVMSILKDRTDWNDLGFIVIMLEPSILSYLASKLRNVYQKYKDQRKIKFLAKRIWEIENLWKEIQKWAIGIELN